MEYYVKEIRMAQSIQHLRSVDEATATLFRMQHQVAILAYRAVEAYKPQLSFMYQSAQINGCRCRPTHFKQATVLTIERKKSRPESSPIDCLPDHPPAYMKTAVQQFSQQPCH
jgi:hypothetical protein